MTPTKKGYKLKLYEIIFEADTKAGKLFDVILLWIIVISIALVMLESMHSVNDQYGHWLKMGEWIVTISFTLEYILRIYVLKKPLSYIFSFYGLVDLLSTLPTYLGLFLTGASGLMVIRVFRLLRIFRIFKLSRYTKEASSIMLALKDSRHKLSVFLAAIVTIVIILGTIMYMIEGEENGFSSIPEGIYWATVTLTTVGYGDISPQTQLGQAIASLAMIIGYATIAVPSVIISAEYASFTHKMNSLVCPGCSSEDHEDDASFCKSCGMDLD